jgi:hypothetical protein
MSDDVIAGYKVHPAASVFPLLEGQEFDELVESVRKNGILHPVVVRRTADGDELIDGRNRLRAAEAVRAAGHQCEVPVMHWNDAISNVSEWIWETNATRRQLTEDAVALASAAIWPLINAENRARKEATQFDSEKAKAARATVRTESYEPSKRDTKTENARSTVGQVAAKAGTSMHKARQAVAVQKAIGAGELPASTANEVMKGRKKLRDVAPKKEPTKQAQNRRLKDKLVELMISVRRAVEKLDENSDPASARRRTVVDELRRLADLLDKTVRKEGNA